MREVSLATSHLITPTLILWITVVLGKLTVVQPVKKLPALYKPDESSPHIPPQFL